MSEGKSAIQKLTRTLVAVVLLLSSILPATVLASEASISLANDIYSEIETLIPEDSEGITINEEYERNTSDIPLDLDILPEFSEDSADNGEYYNEEYEAPDTIQLAMEHAMRSVQFNANFPSTLDMDRFALTRVSSPVSDAWPPPPSTGNLAALFNDVSTGEGTFSQIIQSTGAEPMLSGYLRNLRDGRLEAVGGSAVSSPDNQAWFVRQTSTNWTAVAFGGWYDTVADANEHTSSEGRITRDTVVAEGEDTLHVFARWYPTQRVDFNLQGGAWAPGTGTVRRLMAAVDTAENSVLGQHSATFGQILNNSNQVLEGVHVMHVGAATINTPTRPGYVFAGWRTAPNGEGYEVTSTTRIADISTPEMDELWPGSFWYDIPLWPNLTLHAQWIGEYPVTFAAVGNGEVGATLAGAVIVSGSQHQVGATIEFSATPEVGYQVSSWTINEDVLTGTDAQALTITEDVVTGGLDVVVTFEAMQTTKHQVTFNLNGGNVNGNTSPIVHQIEQGEHISIDNVPMPIRTNHDFAGWRYNAQAVNTQSMARGQVANHVVAGAITFTAQWTPRTGGGNNSGNNSFPGSSIPSIRGGNQSIVAGEEATATQVFPFMPLIDEHIAYISGFPDGSVRPEQSITRAEIAMILFRLIDSAGKHLPQPNHFIDVQAESWYAQAINYLASNNILAGYEDGTFLPNAHITRGELAAVMSRFFELNINGISSFADVTISHWAFAYINNAHSRGWVTGYEDGTFRPNNETNRAEAITLINRVLSRIPNPVTIDYHLANIIVFTDLTSAHWAFYEIMEAAIEHEFELDATGLEIWTNIMSLPPHNEIINNR